MPFDQEPAKQVRAILADSPLLEERKMFGGLAFLVAGRMCCGVIGNDVMLRLGEEGARQLLATEEAAVRPMDFTGRPLKSMVYVDPVGAGRDKLRLWVGWTLEFVRSLPPKEPIKREYRRR